MSNKRIVLFSFLSTLSHILNAFTYNKAKLLVVARVHGLALLNVATVVGLALCIEGNSPQLEDDVPLSLHMQRGILKCCS